MVIAIALTVAASGCGSAQETDSARVSAGESRAGLSAPPISIGEGSQLYGVGEEWLLVRRGRVAAAFDFDSQVWSEVAELPDVLLPAIGSIGPKLVLVGLACSADCPAEEPLPIVTASLDLASPGARWEVKEMSDLSPRPPKFFSTVFVGDSSGAAVFYANHDLLRISSDLTYSRLEMPATRPWLFCATPRGQLTALVVSSEASREPISARLYPTVGPSGNATVAVYSPESKELSAWTMVLPTSSVPAVPSTTTGPEVLRGAAFTSLCGPNGPMLLSGDRTVTYTREGWTVASSVPPLPILDVSYVSTSGTLVTASYAGDFVVWDGSTWTTIPHELNESAGVPVPPTFTVVGDRIVFVEGATLQVLNV